MAALEPPPQMGRNDLLVAALAYAERGWTVFPLHSPGRQTLCDCGDEACTAPAKHPWIRNGFKDASRDARQVAQWWRKWPRANIGIACGASGLVVLDVDPYHGGELALVELVKRHSGAAHGALTPVVEALTATLTSETGGGGEHYVYRAAQGANIRNTTDLDELRGLDVRADGGYFVAAPSLHVSGARYQWREGAGEPGDLPGWILPVLGRRASRPLRQPVRMFQPPRDAQATGAYWLDRALRLAHEGNRNDRGFWLACQLRDAELSFAHAEQVMCDYAARVPGRDYSEREALQSLRSAYRTGPREAARSVIDQANQVANKAWSFKNQETPGEPPPPPPDEPQPTDSDTSETRLHNTDIGNAQRFVRRHGQDVRYVAVWKQWLIWDGKRWKRDETDEIMRRAKDTVKAMWAEVGEVEDHDERKEFIKWIFKSESDSRLKAMLAQAQSEREVASHVSVFDANPWLLNVANGTIDLTTGQLQPHRREDMVTKLAPVTYDPKATLPLWDAFLASITEHNQQLMDFLRRAVGYTLTGKTSEEKLFFAHGPSRTGKSTFLEAIKSTLGEYAMTADFDTFVARPSSGGPRDDVADMAGARMVVSIEVDDGKKLAEGLVKLLTGGDTVKARHLYQRGFEFTPAFKLWLAANHAPRVDATDDAMWNRILRIGFTHVVPTSERKTSVKATLRNPAKAGPAVLAWAVRGCLEWQRDGLGVPQEVEAATDAYRDSMDPIKDFLTDCCALGEDQWISQASLRETYEKWCKANGEKYPVSGKKFGEALRRRACEVQVKRMGNSTVKGWKGVGIVAEM